MNAHIWYNESQVRKGEKGSDNLMLTHGLNGIRNTAINKIMEVVGGRKDYKVDCIAAEYKDWEISWEKKMVKELRNKTNQLVEDMFEMCKCRGRVFTSCLSCAEIMTTLYYGGFIKHDPDNPQWKERDRFMLSKERVLSFIVY